MSATQRLPARLDDITYLGWRFAVTPLSDAANADQGITAIAYRPVDPSTPQDVTAALATLLADLAHWMEEHEQEPQSPQWSPQHACD